MKDLSFGFLKNNLKYSIYKKTCFNTVSILFIINTGSRNEVKNKTGLAHFIEHLLFKGTKKYPNYSLILREIYSINALTNAFTSYEVTGYYFTVPYNFFEKALELMSEFIYNSIFDIKEFEKEKLVVINELKKDRSEPFTILDEKNLNSILKNTNMKNGIGGLDCNIKNFTKKDVINFLKKNYTNSNSIISIAGNTGLNNKKVISLLNKYFNKDFKYGGSKNIVNKLPPIYNNFYPKYFNSALSIINKKFSQAFICLSFVVDPFVSNDYYNTIVLAECIAGPMISILFTLLREREGLVYNIKYSYEYFLEFGILQFVCSTDNTTKNIYKILKIIIHVLDKLKFNLIPIKFLKTIKKYKIGELNKDFDDTFSIAEYNAFDFIYKKSPRSFSYIKNKYLQIDNKDLRRVANNIFLKNKSNLTIITNKNVNTLKIKKYLDKLD